MNEDVRDGCTKEIWKEETVQNEIKSRRRDIRKESFENFCNSEFEGKYNRVNQVSLYSVKSLYRESSAEANSSQVSDNAQEKYGA